MKAFTPTNIKTYFCAIKLTLLIPFLMLSIGLLSGCLPESAKTSLSSTANTFDGATSAKNLGNAIKVMWNTSNTTIEKYNIYRLNAAAELQLINSADPTKTSFVDSDVSLGQIYSYVVRTVDSAGNEDKNNKIVKALVFPGISAVDTDPTRVGRDSLTVTFNPVGGAVEKVIVYAQPVRGGDKVEVGNGSAATGSMVITGLKNGVRYQFSVQAYSSALGGTDGNEKYAVGQTKSYSFDEVAPKDFLYQGVMAVQALGTAAGAPSGQPTQSLIKLTFLPFLNSNPSTKYKVVRTRYGKTLDVTVPSSKKCKATDDDSCVVDCTLQGNTPLVCNDTALPSTSTAGSSRTYDYAITQIYSSGGVEWEEELPSWTTDSDKPYRISVTLPPANMVLVQRDAANYEMCNLMDRYSDPLNHQRCAYTGLGKITKSPGPGKANLNLNPSYYDLGYSFLLDRWETACNWTRATNGGNCSIPAGSSRSTKDCIGDDNPATSGMTANPGNIYYKLRTATDSATSGCWVYLDATRGWRQAYELRSDATLKSTDLTMLGNMTTIDPSLKQRPPMINIIQNDAMFLCKMSRDPQYGRKRLPRLREQRVAAAFSRLSGEEGALSNGDYSNLIHNRRGYTGTYGDCHSIMLGGTTSYALNIVDSFSTFFSSLGNWIVGYGTGDRLDGNAVDTWGYRNFFIGSEYSRKCVSRYGAQDMMGNAAEFVSDKIGPISASPNYSSAGIDLTQYLPNFVLGIDYDSGNDSMKDVVFNGNLGAVAPTSTNYGLWPFVLGNGSGTCNSAATTTVANCRQLTTSVSNSNCDPYTGLCFPNSTKVGVPSYFTAPLGLPYMNDDSGNAMSTSSLRQKVLEEAQYTLYYGGSAGFSSNIAITTGGGIYTSNLIGRFGLGAYFADNQRSGSTGFRCAIGLDDADLKK